MSFLAPLLEIQELDLRTDAARKRIETLPERAAMPALDAACIALDGQIAEARAERAGLQAEEEALGLEVAQLVRDIEAAELERYSGKKKNRDEAVAHDESQRILREKQAALEERELELLEAIERVEETMAAHESARAANRAEADKIREAIAKVESEVEAEVAKISAARGAVGSGVPELVTKAYERVRAQPRAGGRGATVLADGRCGACRIKLPSLEKTRMLAEPEDALIQCPQCRRVLVRGVEV